MPGPGSQVVDSDMVATGQSTTHLVTTRHKANKQLPLLAYTNEPTGKVKPKTNNIIKQNKQKNREIRL